MRIITCWKKICNSSLTRVGPGFVTGVADDDPSGIITYTQAGAQFGLNMLWTMPLAYPLMSAIQILCARIGRVTGKGLAANLKIAFSPLIVMLLVSLLLIANILNIAADIAAMGEVAQLVTGVNWHIMTAFFVLLTLILQVGLPYHRYVFFLRWLTLSLLAYAAVLFTVQIHWKEVIWSTIFPSFELNSSSASVIVGVFGTTISPYLFFWQPAQEVEDMNLRHQEGLILSSESTANTELKRINWDTWGGMFYSNLAAYFIILASAVTLHISGITDISTAAQAASALKPLAGNLTYQLFAIGILGVGLIGVPVLAGSAAYALAEVFNWRSGLENRADKARSFYAVITISILLALGIQYSPISPMKALFWAAVINGLVAVPLMVAILLLSSKSSLMGAYTASKSILALGWIATSIMGVAAVWMFIG